MIVIYKRKRLPGELPSGPAWKGVTEIINSQDETIAVNEYFATHPEMMLGEMRLEGRMYARGEPTLVGNGVPVRVRPRAPFYWRVIRVGEILAFVGLRTG